MIKFFRNIRQKLLVENRFNKYVLYAIGEIILVVIGILIALQINNWNNKNQQEKLEIKYLNEIKSNLKSDIADINFNLAFNKSKLQSNKIILNYLDGKINYPDSLEFHLSNIFFTTRTLANMSAYENLKSRGLEIISNDSLRKRITKLYEFDFYNAIDFEAKDDHQFQYQILIPEVVKSLNITNFNVGKGNINGLAKPIDSELLANNYAFKNALRLNHTFRELMTLTYQNLKNSVEDCITQIDNELKSK